MQKQPQGYKVTTHKYLKVAVVSELKETYSFFGSTTPYVVSANLRLVVQICLSTQKVVVVT